MFRQNNVSVKWRFGKIMWPYQKMLNAHPTIPHIPNCGKRACGDRFSRIFFYKDIFSGDYFSKDLFSRILFYKDLFSGYHFSKDLFSRIFFIRTFFPGTIFPRTSFPGFFFSRTFFPETIFPGIFRFQGTFCPGTFHLGIFFPGDLFSGIHFCSVPAANLERDLSKKFETHQLSPDQL